MILFPLLGYLYFLTVCFYLFWCRKGKLSDKSTAVQNDCKIYNIGKRENATSPCSICPSRFWLGAFELISPGKVYRYIRSRGRRKREDFEYYIGLRVEKFPLKLKPNRQFQYQFFIWCVEEKNLKYVLNNITNQDYTISKLGGAIMN